MLKLKKKIMIIVNNDKININKSKKKIIIQLFEK